MRALRTDVDKRWEPLSMLRGPPHPATEEPVGHRAGHAGGSLLRDRGVRAGPAAVDGVVEDLEPLVKQLRGERTALVEQSMVLESHRSRSRVRRGRRGTNSPAANSMVGGSVHRPPVGRTSRAPSSCFRCSASNPPTHRASGARSTPSPAVPAPASRYRYRPATTASPARRARSCRARSGSCQPCRHRTNPSSPRAAHRALRARQPTRALRRGDRPRQPPPPWQLPTSPHRRRAAALPTRPFTESPARLGSGPTALGSRSSRRWSSAVDDGGGCRRSPLGRSGCRTEP